MSPLITSVTRPNSSPIERMIFSPSSARPWSAWADGYSVAGENKRFQATVPDRFAYAFDLLFGCPELHEDDHWG